MNNKLIKCKTCGRDVSAGAAKCPHCGEPTRSRRVMIVCICIAIALWLSADFIADIIRNLP